MRAFSMGASTVFSSVWPVLKSLPEMGIDGLGGELAQHRRVDREVRRAVGERDALEERGVGVEHRRGDRRVVGVDGRLERLEVEVGRTGLDEHLGRAGPDHHDPVEPGARRLKRLMPSRMPSSIPRLLRVGSTFGPSRRFT